MRLCYNANERAAELARTEPGIPDRVGRIASQLPSGAAGVSLSSWNVSQAPPGALVPHDTFYSRAINTIPDHILHMDYERWRASGFKRQITSPIVLCHYPFLFDAGTKRKLLEYEAALQMSLQAHAAMVFMRSSGFASESPFLELQIRRDSIVRDTANQISIAPPSFLKKKLRVTFAGEEALDAGGAFRQSIHSRHRICCILVV